jgi:transcriptional regulator with XRE-family HTH domain
LTETTFYGGVHPLALLDERGETPFLSMPSRRKAGPLRTLRKLDAMTDIVDQALAEPLDWTPLSVEPQWLLTSGFVEHASDETGLLRERALAAIADIRSTLVISDAAAASLVRVARNTLASWRKGERDPYPATLRMLFEIHSVVAAASALLGDDARSWFHGYAGDETRLSVLAHDGGAQRIAAELRARLFPDSGTPTLPTADDTDAEGPAVEGIDEVAYIPDAFTQPVARRRRVR